MTIKAILGSLLLATSLQASQSYYALTSAGGTANDGTLSTVTSNGTFTVLFNFPVDNNQVVPVGAVVQGTNGLLYGVAQDGGSHNAGYLFRISTFGQMFTNLYSLNGTTDGVFPNGTLCKATDGRFYGTCSGPTFGTIFSMGPSGGFTVLHTFAGAADGGTPLGTIIQSTNGSLFGMTETGGANNNGAVYKVTLGGTFTLLYSFTTGAATTDGKNPTRDLVQANDGDFYGFCSAGGANNKGTLFKITQTGTFTLLHSFSGASDGDSPFGNMIQGGDGSLYGMTSLGGANAKGTIIKSTLGGSITLLYSFSSAGTSDGTQPTASLFQGDDNFLYGMTQFGGANNKGAMFRSTTAGSFTLLHSFNTADGVNPDGSVLGLTPIRRKGKISSFHPKNSH